MPPDARQFTVDEIKDMSMEDYAKYRNILLEQYKPQLKAEWGQVQQDFESWREKFVDPMLACYYCGVVCDNEEARDEHEEACATELRV